MSGWIGPLIAAVLAAFVGFVGVLEATPRLIMTVAMQRLSGDGMALNRLIHAPRVTETARRVVRPSPDLAYSICVYDLSGGPIDLAFQPGEAYGSLSLFAANTDNFFRVNDSQLGGERFTARLSPPGAQPADGAIVSPSIKGIALIRRLAPSPEAFAAARALGDADACGPDAPVTAP